MGKPANYREFTDLPAWTQAVWRHDADGGNYMVVNDADPFKWSGKEPPPAIGDRVHTRMNRLGWGTVLRYFVEYGWLGVLVALDAPPEWYTKQNKGNPAAHIFGVDLDHASTRRI